MKRTDALKKIQGHYNITSYTAQELLNFIEKELLMTPPPYIKSLLEPYEIAETEFGHFGPVMGKIVTEWEPENG